MTHPIHHSRRAITLAETVVSTLLIGFVLASTLQIIGPMINSTTIHADRLVAANLANELAEEIASKLFIDPNAVNQDDIGIDPDDIVFNRTNYDDIDDYNNWSSSPPKMSYGVTNPALTGWTRSVTVNHAVLSDPNQSTATYTGLKKVIVQVRKNGILLADTHSLHSQAGDSLGFTMQAR